MPYLSGRILLSTTPMLDWLGSVLTGLRSGLSFRTAELSPTRCPGSCIEIVLFFSILIKHGRLTRAPSGVAPIATSKTPLCSRISHS